VAVRSANSRQRPGLATTEGWWDEYRRVIPDSYLELIVAEARATRVQTFNSSFIPGLLQTPEYASEITVATTLKPTPVEVSQARVEVRLRRQTELLNRNSFRLLAFIDEMTLYRPVGEPRTMREQLDHLVTALDRPNLTLRVIPRRAGPHPGQLGTYLLVEFGDPRQDDLLFFEAAMGNLAVRGQPEVVAGYRELSNRLVHIGQSVQLARTLILNARASY
jgi:hypothetical protein